MMKKLRERDAPPNDIVFRSAFTVAPVILFRCENYVCASCQTQSRDVQAASLSIAYERVLHT